MASVESRLTALAAELQRRAMLQAEPLDSLSASLFSMQDELSALDDEGRAVLLRSMNNPDDSETDSLRLIMQDIEQMINDWRPQ